MHLNPMFKPMLGLLAVASQASAFFRLPCAAPIVIQRADPVVNPGKVSSHVHTIMGGNGFGFEMNFASTQRSTCSSCTVKEDMSNYWTPVSDRRLVYNPSYLQLLTIDQSRLSTSKEKMENSPKLPRLAAQLFIICKCDFTD